MRTRRRVHAEKLFRGVGALERADLRSARRVSGADAGMLPASKTGRLRLAVAARLVFVRTEAIRLRHAVGGAVLTVANQCSACFGGHRGKHPLRGMQVRCGCSAIGVALSATPMRNVVLIDAWPSVVALRATTFSVPRGMIPRGVGAYGTDEIGTDYRRSN